MGYEHPDLSAANGLTDGDDKLDVTLRRHRRSLPVRVLGGGDALVTHREGVPLRWRLHPNAAEFFLHRLDDDVLDLGVADVLRRRGHIAVDQHAHVARV
jgi:hypothetical protein